MKLDWDHFSDQPAVIRDKALKKQIYNMGGVKKDLYKMLATNLVMYPLCFLKYLLFPTKNVNADTREFFGMSINLDKHPEQTRALVDDLGADNLLIRMPLSDIENIEQYVAFAEQFKDKNLLINILQDRRHVEDLKLLSHSLNTVFIRLSPLTQRFQLGNAINRKKWAIFSMDEFLAFYKVGYELRNARFPDIKLLGSSVIDFEYYFSIRTLFNRQKVKYDQFSSLLYVDRRGAPENTQMGLDLLKKLRLMQAMLSLSPKSSNEIVITETNWPITNTHPYAPTSENDCVSLEDQADFLVRYYLLALASGVVKNVYWHQLIAPGYGLMDDRGDTLVKYPSYTAFKVMLSQLQGATFEKLVQKSGVYCAQFSQTDTEQNAKKIEVYWCNEPLAADATRTISDTQSAVDVNGNLIKANSFSISGSPIYLTTKITH
ncbi:hypothetical protein EOL70_04615 [Leucothrix sargassi]|nr:hypothetical protein EOL70_04615 [Leucothrix sargassi]